MKNIFPLLIAICLLAGCAAGPGSYSAIDDRTNYHTALEQLSADAAQNLAAKYPPGRTVLEVIPYKENSRFAEYFENALRERGFSIGQGGISVKYVVDFVEKNTMYLTITVNDGYGFSCFYNYGGRGKPVIQQGKSIFGE